ncbi:MAG: prepilin-type N-terminal cleavage/methylation domain-containing protein [Patescibacteria group bacterium]|jgi:prepilin-type N-terminal cleavage/methylation domain-containing protein
MKKNNKLGFTPTPMLGVSLPSKRGFTLIEILVVIAIIGLLASFSVVAFSSALKKGRDAKRKSDINQVGKFLSLSCYVPDAGAGKYDLATLFEEIKIKNPQISTFIKSVPKDPSVGTNSQTYYLYEVTTDGKKCALYANLENANEQITLPNLTLPTPGGGTGVLQANENGPNKTNKYFQYSN